MYVLYLDKKRETGEGLPSVFGTKGTNIIT
jgi:hypothetical protein